jgi:hypothetical protein
MNNKRFWLGILVMILAFGMVVVGCDNGSTNGKSNNPPKASDFYAFWESANGEIYQISATEISWTKGLLAGTYDLSSAVAAQNANELTNDEFPSGFAFASSGGLRTLYLSTNKKRFIDGEDSVIYSKKAEAPVFTVTFDANGGTPTPASQSVRWGGKVTEPQGVTHNNTGPMGWSVDKTSTNAWNFATDTVTKDITLYAVWEGSADVPTKVTDFYAFWESANGTQYLISATEIGWSKGIAGTYNLTSAVTAQNVNELTNAEFPDGFVFTSSGGLKTLYLSTNKTRFIDGADSVIYTKKAQAPLCTVTFDAQGGKPTPAPQYIRWGGKVTEPQGVTLSVTVENPSSEDNPDTGTYDAELRGWSEGSGNSYRMWNFETDTVIRDITLCAVWEIPGVGIW